MARASAQRHRRRDDGGADQGRSARRAVRSLSVRRRRWTYSADNLAELSRGLGRYILSVPMRKVRDIETEVLTRPGRYKPVADNLQVKEVWVGDGERRKRYVLCLNRKRQNANARDVRNFRSNSMPGLPGSSSVRTTIRRPPVRC